MRRAFLGLCALSALASGCFAATGEEGGGVVPRVPDIGGREPALSIDDEDDGAGPLSTRIDPVVVAMPSWAETTVESVARYLAAREPNRRRRIKALHDWVADRLTYDVERARRSDPSAAPPPAPGGGLVLRPPCTNVFRLCPAEPVAAPFPGEPLWKHRGTTPRHELASRAFDERRAVCAGYAALLEALGAAIGEDIVYVTGLVARDKGGLLAEHHAWNVARTGRGYEVIDVTWDSGFSSGDSYSKRYSTEWLYVRPDAFALTHRPDDARWALRSRPAESLDLDMSAVTVRTDVHSTTPSDPSR